MRTAMNAVSSAVGAGLTLCFAAACAKKPVDLQGAVITAMRGTITVSETSGKSRSLGAADLYTKAGLLTPGMSLVTGPESQADLQFTSGFVMRIQSCSTVKLEDAQIILNAGYRRVVMKLQSGAVYARTDKLTKNSSVSVIAPTAVASVRGTQFLVKDGGCGIPAGRTETLVEDGSVVVADASGKTERSVEAGGKATVDAGGVVLASMSDSEKKEIGTAGLDIKVMTPEEKSRVEKILDAFEENTVRFRSVLGNSQRSETEVRRAETAAPNVSPETKKTESAQTPAETKNPVTPQPEPRMETKTETKPDPQPEKKKADADNTPMM